MTRKHEKMWGKRDDDTPEPRFFSRSSFHFQFQISHFQYFGIRHWHSFILVVTFYYLVFHSILRYMEYMVYLSILFDNRYKCVYFYENRQKELKKVDQTMKYLLSMSALFAYIVTTIFFMQQVEPFSYACRFGIVKKQGRTKSRQSCSAMMAMQDSSTVVTATETTTEYPRLSVILFNLQSGSNIGRICRNCLIFGVSEVLIVGRKNYMGKMRFADRGARHILTFKHFPSLREAQDYLQEQSSADKRRLKLVGVEIDDKARSIYAPDALDDDSCATDSKPNVAFLFGNEGAGLSPTQRSICDRFVFIPQYVSGVASLNVACASAIILSEAARWASFPELSHEEGKFPVNPANESMGEDNDEEDS